MLRGAPLDWLTGALENVRDRNEGCDDEKEYHA